MEYSILNVMNIFRLVYVIFTSAYGNIWEAVE